MVNKFRNKKITRNGITYDSQKEANRHAVLKLLERSGRIKDLQRQVKFDLVPAQRDAAGKLLERAVSYVADFTYYENGKLVVEDVKGFKTPEYKLKKKMLLYFHGLHIKET